MMPLQYIARRAIRTTTKERFLCDAEGCYSCTSSLRTPSNVLVHGSKTTWGVGCLALAPNVPPRSRTREISGNLLSSQQLRENHRVEERTCQVFRREHNDDHNMYWYRSAHHTPPIVPALAAARVVYSTAARRLRSTQTPDGVLSPQREDFSFATTANNSSLV